MPAPAALHFSTRPCHNSGLIRSLFPPQKESALYECDILLEAGVIVTQDEGRRVLAGHSLALLDGKIAAIGPAAEMAAAWRGQRLDLSGCLVCPGLVNAHTHAAMTFARGLADDLPLMDWLTGRIFPLEARLRPEIVRLASLLGYAEMLSTGTTACMDMYIFEDAVFEAARLAGLRVTGGEAVFMFPSAACADHKAALRETERLAEKYAGDARLSVAVNPHSVYTTTPEILRACADLARRLDLPMHIHLAENSRETELCLHQQGKRPVAYCESLGLLDLPLTAAHVVDVTEEEIALLAKKGVRVAHNPASNQKLSSGVAPVTDMLRHGCRVGLGTDGPASNNCLNMFREMSRAALAAKTATSDPCALDAQSTLDMASRGGACALHNPGIGSLAPGMCADLTALDMSQPNMQPMFNPVSQLVYAASGHECRMTMVAGEILYQNGKFTRFDYADVLGRLNELRDFAAQN